MEKTIKLTNGEEMTFDMNGKYNYVIDGIDLGFLTDEIDFLSNLLMNGKTEDDVCIQVLNEMLRYDYLEYSSDKTDHLSDVERTLTNLIEMYYHTDRDYEVDLDWLSEQRHLDWLTEFVNDMSEAIENKKELIGGWILLEVGNE